VILEINYQLFLSSIAFIIQKFLEITITTNYLMP